LQVVSELSASSSSTRSSSDSPPKRRKLIGDRAYDSDKLDEELKEQHGLELIAPNRSNRRKTQDGRPLRSYRRRSKIERLFAWPKRYRRIIMRWETKAENFLGFLHLACLAILLRRS
jgi:transposase